MTAAESNPPDLDASVRPLSWLASGAGHRIAMTQLPNRLGVPGGGDHLFERGAIHVPR